MLLPDLRGAHDNQVRLWAAADHGLRGRQWHQGGEGMAYLGLEHHQAGGAPLSFQPEEGQVKRRTPAMMKGISRSSMSLLMGSLKTMGS